MVNHEKRATGLGFLALVACLWLAHRLVYTDSMVLQVVGGVCALIGVYGMWLGTELASEIKYLDAHVQELYDARAKCGQELLDARVRYGLAVDQAE